MKFYYISFLLCMLLFSHSQAQANTDDLYEHLSQDEQFLIFSPEKNLSYEIENIAIHLKEEISSNLNIFFQWKTPAEIIIHRDKKWPKPIDAYIYNKPSDKEAQLGMQTFMQDNLEEKIIFKSLTSLILSEILIKETNKIKKFEGEQLPIPLCFLEGLWRHIAGFNTLTRLKQIDTLRLNQILFSNEQLISPALFQIKSTALVHFLLNQPFGKIKFRKIIIKLATKKTSKWIKEIIKIYKFKDEKSFNDAWEEYIQALILSKETEDILLNRKTK